jgi:hypothetical protein
LTHRYPNLLRQQRQTVHLRTVEQSGCIFPLPFPAIMLNEKILSFCFSLRLEHSENVSVEWLKLSSGPFRNPDEINTPQFRFHLDGICRMRPILIRDQADRLVWRISLMNPSQIFAHQEFRALLGC